jgi:hypothetical protein
LNGGNIAGATNGSYTFTNLTASGGGNVSVFVRNVAGTAVSTNARLKVFVAPVLTGQPVSRSVTVSNAVGFSASASGTAPLFYQWWFGPEPIPGATNSSYNIARALTNQAGAYRVAVSNFAGVATSSNAMLAVNVRPYFLLQPVSQAVPLGGAAAFNVAVAGTAPFKYQWRKNGGNIAGATNASLAILNVTNSNAGSYSVFVQNVAGSITSSNATLSVLPAVLARSPAEAPTVGFAVGGGVIVLTWPASAGAFTLQSSADLQSWQGEPAPVMQGDTYAVTNHMQGHARFYRLVR